jgi:protein-S-isoprenylcysteine O-methyltransferase Ste14
MVSTLLAGLLLMVAGTAWAAWAAWTLRRAGTPLVPQAAPRVLVEEGPYRLGRHPIYLGGLVAAAGLALVLGSLLLLAATLSALWLVARVLVPAEERQLARTFGGWYRDYAGNVRRWV